MYTDDNNSESDNDKDEKVFFILLILITDDGHQNPLHPWSRDQGNNNVILWLFVLLSNSSFESQSNVILKGKSITH